MNNHAAIHANAPQPLLSAPLRFATAIAIGLVAALAVLAAQHESQRAVQNVTGILGTTVHVTLPSVEVVGRRERSTSARGGAAG